MKQRWLAAAAKVDRLSLRERLMVFAAVLVVLGGLWEVTLASPLAAREQRAAAAVAGLKERLERLNRELAAVAAGMTAGVGDQAERLTALRARVDDGEEEMRVFTSDLVDPAQMRLVLEELLRRQPGLILVSAANLDPRPLVAEAEGSAAGNVADDSDERPKLYRHTLRVTLRGAYFDLLAYLEAAERLPWQLHWAWLAIDAGEYPENDIVLELNTLSLAEEWIGV